MRRDEGSPVVWDADGAPRSRLFDDVYFSSTDGLAESRAVFLQGCGLPAAWRGRRRFVVGELGFGSGLNILALLDLWSRTRGPGARLNIFSVEAFPMDAADAARVLGAWPELAGLAGRLVERWPRRARGFHRLDFPEVGACLDLAVMDVAEALDAWGGAADAWFLDGFSPAANPAMWSQEVLAALAARSAPGARAATFTVAGAVRRGLAEQGFAVAKRPGFGRKRERLEAVWPGEPPPEPPAPPRVAIIGGGIAGAALARAFAAEGANPIVFEAEAPGAGASGNPAGLVMPRLDAGGGSVAQLYAQAFARAADLFDAIPGAVIACGALQLEVGPKDKHRFDRIASSDIFAVDALVRLSAAEAGEALGEACPVGALKLTDGRVVEPAVALQAWLTGQEVRRVHVASLEQAADGWRLLDAAGQLLMVADIVCLANGLAARDLAVGLPLSPVRGQVSTVATADRPGAVIGGGYLIPTREGVLFGATHDRDDTGAAARPEDHARNLDLLAQARPVLAEALRGAPMGGRASVRAACPDFLPLAGQGEGRTGLHVLSGLGSRGFCAAPLLAEHVAALALGAPSPLPKALAAIVDPARFAVRARRRRSETLPVT